MIEQMWTKEQYDNYLKSIAKTKQDLRKTISKYCPYDYGCMLQVIEIMITNMLDYFEKGINVWQSEEERIKVVNELKEAKRLCDVIYDVEEDDKLALKAFFEYIGNHISDWWD